MDWHGFLQTVNWRTFGYGIAFAICKIFGSIFPQFSTVCDVVETLIVTGGFISTADASRVQNVVRAVDYLLFKSKTDPGTIPPDVLLTPPAAPAPATGQS